MDERINCLTSILSEVGIPVEIRSKQVRRKIPCEFASGEMTDIVSEIWHGDEHLGTFGGSDDRSDSPVRIHLERGGKGHRIEVEIRSYGVPPELRGAYGVIPIKSSWWRLSEGETICEIRSRDSDEIVSSLAEALRKGLYEST